MNGLIPGFRKLAYLAGETAGFSNGQLIRDFGLKDFLENGIQEEDDAPTICVKALRHFCDDEVASGHVFQFTVLTVCTFLHRLYADRKTDAPLTAMRDLVSIMCAGASEPQIRQWITSHFGAGHG